MVCITRHLQPIPFDPEKDFVAGRRAWRPRGASSPSIPRCRRRTVAEFVAYARPTPARSTSARRASATITHLFGEMLNLEAGIKMTHVPYNGSAPATNDLLAGEVQAQFDQTCLPQSRRASCSGSPCWPRCAGRDSPTSRPCAKRATARTAAIRWFGILAPAGTSPAVVAQLDQAIAESLTRPTSSTRCIMAACKSPISTRPTSARASASRARCSATSSRRGNITLLGRRWRSRNMRSVSAASTPPSSRPL